MHVQKSSWQTKNKNHEYTIVSGAQQLFLSNPFDGVRVCFQAFQCLYGTFFIRTNDYMIKIVVCADTCADPNTHALMGRPEGDIWYLPLYLVFEIEPLISSKDCQFSYVSWLVRFGFCLYLCIPSTVGINFFITT